MRATGILDGTLVLDGFLTSFGTWEVAGIAVAVALHFGLLTFKLALELAVSLL